MRKGKIFIYAINTITNDENICYSGKDFNEARYTIAELRRMDREDGNIGLYQYIIKEQLADGSFVRRGIDGKIQNMAAI